MALQIQKISGSLLWQTGIFFSQCVSKNRPVKVWWSRESQSPEGFHIIIISDRVISGCEKEAVLHSDISKLFNIQIIQCLCYSWGSALHHKPSQTFLHTPVIQSLNSTKFKCFRDISQDYLLGLRFAAFCHFYLTIIAAGTTASLQQRHIIGTD